MDEQKHIKDTYIRKGVYYCDFRLKVNGKSKRFRQRLGRDEATVKKMVKIIKANAQKEADSTKEILGKITLDGLKNVATLQVGGLKLQASYDPEALFNTLMGENIQTLEIRG